MDLTALKFIDFKPSYGVVPLRFTQYESEGFAALVVVAQNLQALVKENPGAYTPECIEEINNSIGTLGYHLNRPILKVGGETCVDDAFDGDEGLIGIGGWAPTGETSIGEYVEEPDE